MTINVDDPNELNEVNCNLEVNVEEAEGYHQNESIQTRQSYSFTSHLSLLHLSYDPQ